jgi:hypothetical protein
MSASGSSVAKAFVGAGTLAMLAAAVPPILWVGRKTGTFRWDGAGSNGNPAT